MTGKVLKGKLRIGHPSNQFEKDGTEYFYIAVECKSSGVKFIEVKIAAQDLTLAIAGRYGVPCEFELNQKALNKVGKIHQYKTEFVVFENGYRDFDEVFDEKVKPFEVDGWVAERSGYNDHRYDYKTKEHQVMFRRYVDNEHQK